MTYQLRNTGKMCTIEYCMTSQIFIKINIRKEGKNSSSSGLIISLKFYDNIIILNKNYFDIFDFDSYEYIKCNR